MQHKPIKCAVKNFVNFACRTGNLEGFGAAGPTAAEGQKAHKKLQSKKAADEESEVKVECRLEVNNRQLHLSGRVDLLNNHPQSLCVSEIKSCYAPPHKLPQSTVQLHWAQLKVYGYCVLDQHNALPEDKISLQLIWYNIIADELIYDKQVFNFSELTDFVHNAAQHYVEWISLIQTQFSTAVEQATALSFPHADFRAGQRNMAAAVYLSARDRFHLMCEAPTGIGKTVSALFPAIKAMGNGDLDRIIYLTAKNSGRKAAADSLSTLTTGTLKLSAVTITAKKTTCHCSNGTCDRNAEDGSCPLTIGFFDRLPEARLQLIQSGIITPDAIDSAAHEFALCPFELTLQMLPWVQVVVCDFNYVFDPLVRLSALTENTARQILLVDEAHNLTDRARSMYSATLDKQQIKLAIKELDKQSLQVKNLRAINRAIDKQAKEYTEAENATAEKPKAISRVVKKFLQSAMDDNIPTSEATNEAYKAIFRYAVIDELYGDHHRVITRVHGQSKFKNTQVTLQCLNATEFLKKSYKQYKSTVTFSATLRPLQFYFESLGLPEQTKTLSLESPFDANRQCTLICNWVDTRYKSRQSAINSIVEVIHSVYSGKRGNYQVFFPSYSFMMSVYDAFTAAHPDLHAIMQQRSTSEEERQTYLQQFEGPGPLLAFSILGGVFAEGVDYRGDRLIGSIIIGTGLASIDTTQKLIEDDFRQRGLDGFDYGSRFPGFTRVLQTAGRVIRTEADKGVVVLVDQRFDQPAYKKLYPPHWSPVVCSNSNQLKERLQHFWRRFTE